MLQEGEVGVDLFLGEAEPPQMGAKRGVVHTLPARRQHLKQGPKSTDDGV